MQAQPERKPDLHLDNAYGPGDPCWVCGICVLSPAVIFNAIHIVSS